MDRKNNNFGLYFARTLCYIVLIFLVIISLAPFYILIINSSRSNYAIQSGFAYFFESNFFINLKNALDNPAIDLFAGIRNSLFVSSAITIVSVYFSALTAYAIHAYNFRLKKYAFSFILLIMMVPVQISALGFFDMIFKWGALNTYWPLIIPTIAAPATFYFIKQYMEGALPLEIVEEARIDGSREFYTFNRIILPILKPAMAVQAIFTFVMNWNNYFMPALLLSDNKKKTLPLVVAQLRASDYMRQDNGQVYMIIFIAVITVKLVY